MLISVSKNREYTCNIGEGVDAVFKYPNATESLQLFQVMNTQDMASIAGFIAKMFSRLDGKIEAKAQDGNTFEITTMAQLLELGGKEAMELALKCIAGYRDAVKQGSDAEKKQK